MSTGSRLPSCSHGNGNGDGTVQEREWEWESRLISCSELTVSERVIWVEDLHPEQEFTFPMGSHVNGNRYGTVR